MDKEKFIVSLAITIRTARIKKRLTQIQVSSIMGIDTQNLSKYERGLISPSVFWLIKYCEAIDYDPVIFHERIML